MIEVDPADRFRPSERAALPSAASTRGRSLLVVCAIVASLLLVWLILRVTLAAAIAGASPDLARMIAPEMPAVAVSETAGEALAREPLQEDALLIGARAALSAGEARLAGRMIEEAYRRNPRSRQALLMLVEHQIRNDRLREAVYTMARLSRLVPNAAKLVTGGLVRMAREPELRAPIAAVLANDPNLSSGVLQELARSNADPELLLALAGPDREVDGEAPQWQALLLQRMVQAGDLAEARHVWERLTGIERGAGIYDPDFAGLPGPTPFNWSLEATSEGFAERSGDGAGLYAEFYGRRPTIVARQLLTLSPGRYRLRFEAEGSAEGDGGYLVWALSCHPDGPVIAQIPLRGVGFPGRALAVRFAVPPGCSAQWLQLQGRSAEFPKQQQATIRSLRIVEGG